MPEVSSKIAEDVLAACRHGAGEAAGALSRALDRRVTLSVGQPGALQPDALPSELAGPGLAVVLEAEAGGGLLLLPERGGLLPPSYAQTDPTTRSKLDTLAQELGTVLLPGELSPHRFRAARSEDLGKAVRRGRVSEQAAVVPLQASADDHRATALFIWPVEDAAAVLAGPPEGPSGPADRPTGGRSGRAPRRRGGRELPPYIRSLLHIKVPVLVKLAQKRQPLGHIVELGPGSIIQFSKSCEEMLEMAVGGRPIATGEAVKVGDKFGLRITSIILPEERFQPVEKMKG